MIKPGIGAGASAAQPRVRAEFVTDQTGKPQVIEQDDVRHYAIKLHVDNAPADTIGVSYGLHETYYDPLRVAHDPKDNFAETITSYGDFDVLATLMTKPVGLRLRSSLLEALKVEYGESASDAITEALRDIEEH